jgi:hypothetical protein
MNGLLARLDQFDEMCHLSVNEFTLLEIKNEIGGVDAAPSNLAKDQFFVQPTNTHASASFVHELKFHIGAGFSFANVHTRSPRSWLRRVRQGLG